MDGHGNGASKCSRGYPFRMSPPTPRTWLSRPVILVLFAIAPPALALADASQRKAPSCAGHKATIMGDQRGEDVIGTSGRDVIVLGDGGDSADGRGGNDVICAGGGPDNIRGGGGRDLLLGGDANDNLYGQAGEDDLLGNSGDDRLLGGSRDDVLDGGRDFDETDLSEAPRRVVVNIETQRARGHGTDRLEQIEGARGSRFDDLLVGDSNENILNGWYGRDEVLGRDGCDRLDGGSGPDLVRGGGGNDMIVDDVGSNQLFGEDGNDYLIGSDKGLGDGGGNGNYGDICDAVGTAVGCEHSGGAWGCRI